MFDWLLYMLGELPPEPTMAEYFIYCIASLLVFFVLYQLLMIPMTIFKWIFGGD